MKKLGLLFLFVTSSVCLEAAGQLPVNLGSAGNFTVLAASTVTNTGPTIVHGNVGLSPGVLSSVTGFPPGIVVGGAIHAADTDGAAALAQLDLTAAYNDAAGRTTPIIVAGDLGGLTLPPGLYKSTSTLGITGVLTLDGQGNSNSVFIFQIASGLTTATGSQIVLIGGAQAANVFFQVGSSATLGVNSIFNGTILAQASVTLATGATLNGRALARTAAVTLDSNPVNNPGPPVTGVLTGFVQVCKVAGAGVAPGTNFTFNVAGTPATVPAGAAPAGTCGTPISVSAGTATITETIPANTVLAGVSTSPDPGFLLSSNLATGTATVTVLAGGQTIVTFIDAATPTAGNGFVQVCKIAGAGVPVGTNFAFNIGGTPATIPAGAAPGGTCGAPVTVPAGPVVITETIPANTQLAGVGTLPSPGLLVSSNLAGGTATVTAVSGGQTIATFIDIATPAVPTNGFVQVCKVAGAGVAVGTNFAFNVGGTPLTVPAGAAPGGSCGPPLLVPSGPVAIAETLPTGTQLAGVSTLPSGLLVSSTLGAGTATVTVLPSGQTIVTFIDDQVTPISAIPVMSPAILAGFALLLAGLGWVFSRKARLVD